jgi:hypothetical protein
MPNPGEIANPLLSAREEHGQRGQIRLIVLPIVRDYDKVLALMRWRVEGDKGLAGETMAFEHLEGKGEGGKGERVTSIQVHIGGCLSF